MLSEKMEGLLNDQMQREMYSSYLYLAMSAYFESQNLPGFGHWMRLQAQEEQSHAMKFFSYINQRGGRVVLKAIDAPQKAWDSPLAAFAAAYKHEQFVTGHINDLANAAHAERDNATWNMLQWFVNEQVEEEATVQLIVHQLEMIQGAPHGLLMMDRALGARQ